MRHLSRFRRLLTTPVPSPLESPASLRRLLALARTGIAPALGFALAASGAHAQYVHTFTTGGENNATAYVTTSGNRLDLNFGGLSVTQSGVISGPGSLRLTGSGGTLSLTGANTFSGGTLLQGGRVIGRTAQAFGTGTITVGDYASDLLIDLNALYLSGISNNIHVAAGTTPATIGTVGVRDREEWRTAPTFSGNLQLDRPVTLQHGISNSVDARTTFSGVISGNVGTLSIAGGRVTLRGANTFTGDVNILGGSLLQLDGDPAQPSLQILPLDSGVHINDGGTLQFAGDHTIGSLSGGAGAVVQGLPWIFAKLTVNQTEDGTFAGRIRPTLPSTPGGGGVAFEKAGPATLTLSGYSNHTLGTTVSGGVLRLLSPISLGHGPIVLSGGTLAFSGFTGINFESLSGTSDLSLTNEEAQPVAVTIGESNAPTTYSGRLSGLGSINKIGTGTLTLSGDNTFSGLTTIQGGTLQLGAGGATGGLTGNIVNNGALVVNRTGELALAGDISGSGSLTKTGAGTLTLTGANTYSGGTTLAGGTLSVPTLDGLGSSTKPLSFQGGILRLTDAGVTDLGAFTFNHDSFNGGFDIAEPGATFTVSENLSGPGSLTKAGAGTLVLNGANTLAGGVNVSGGVLRLGSANAIGPGPLTLSGGTLDFGSLTSLSVGSLAGTSNLVLENAAAEPVAFTAGSNNTSTDYSGALSGSGSLAKVGTGTLTLSGANTYTGGTAIRGGALSVASLSQLGAVGSSLVVDGGVLRVTGTNTQNLGVFDYNYGSFNGAIDVVNASALVLAPSGLSGGGSGSLTKLGAGTLDLGSNNAASFASLILDDGTLSGYVTSSLSASTIELRKGVVSLSLTGSGALSKTGSGTVTLATANTFSGVATISAGTLRLGHASALGSATASLSGGALDFYELASVSLGGLSGSGNLALANAYSAPVALTVGVGGANSTYTGVLSAAGSLTKNGTGTFRLSGSNTYSGGTVVNGGTLVGGRIDSFGSGAVTLAAGTNGVLFDRTAIIDQTVTKAFTVSAGSGSATLGTMSNDPGDGAWTNFGGNLVLNRPTTLVDGGTAPNGRTSFSGVISGNVGTLTIQGGRVTMSGLNTFTGDVRVETNSMLQMDSDAQIIPLASNVHLAGTGSVFQVVGAGRLGSLTGAAGSSVQSVPNGNSTFTVGGNNQSTTFDGIFKNGPVTIANRSSVLSVAKIGTGILTLTGQSTHTGFTSINAGSIRLADSLALATTQVQLGGGSLSFGTLTSATLGGLSGNGNLALANANSQPVALTLQNTSDTIFSGVLSGAGSLIKTGNYTQYLGGLNTHTGGTNVQGGLLVLQSGGQVGALRGALTIGPGASVWTTANNGLGWGAGTKIDTLTINGGTLQNLAAGSHGLGIAYTLNGGVMSSNNGVSSATAASHFSVDGASSFNVTGATPSTIAGRLDLRGDGGFSNVAFTVADGSRLNITAGVSSHSGSTLEGPVGIVKQGAGVLALTGANTYTGNTTINGGFVEFNSASALGVSNRVILNGGGLRWASGNTADISARIDPLGVGGATFDTNGNTVSFATALSGTGAVTKSGTGTLTLSAANTHSGGTIVNGGTLTLGGPEGTGVGVLRGNLTINSGATVRATASNALGYATGTKINAVTINGGTLLHTGAADQGWGIAYTLNGATMSSNNGVSSSSTGSKFSFGGPTGANTSVTVSGSTPSTIAGRVDLRTDNGNSNVDFTVGAGANLLVSAAITNTGAFTKKGDGVMTLTGANTYSGGTTIQGGLVEFSALNSFGTGAINLTGGGLRWAAGNTTDISASSQFNRTLGASSTTFDTNGNNVTLGSVLSGSGALAKAGSGVLKLSAANTYAGGTIIQGGLVEFSAGSSLGTGSVTLNGGGLRWAAGNTTDISSRLNSIGASGAPFDTNGNNVSFASALSGSGALAKNGAGTLALSTVNTYAGGTTVNGGTLELAGPASTGAGVIRGALTIANGATVRTSAVNAFGFNTGAKIDSVTINGGTLDHTAAGELGRDVAYTLNGGTLSSNGGVSSASAASRFSFDDDTSVTVGASTSATIAGRVDLLPGSTDLDVATGGSLTVSAALTSTGGLVKKGAGTLFLTGANTYSGGTVLQGGVVEFNQLASFGTGNIAFDGGGLRWAAGNTTDISSSSQISLVLGAAGALFDTNGNDVTLASAFSGSGTLTKTGAGTLTLSGANTHAGGVSVLGGVLAVPSFAQLGSDGGLMLNGGGLRFTGSGLTETFARTVTLGAGGATVDTRDNDLAFLDLAGSGMLTKTGDGALTLHDTHIGTTTVSGGTLRIAGGAYLTNVVNNARVEFASTDEHSITGTISGTGSVLKSGPGIQSFNNATHYSGGTTITGGELRNVYATTGGGPAFGTGPITLDGADTALKVALNPWSRGIVLANAISVPAGPGSVTIGTYSHAASSINYFTYGGPLSLNRPTTLVNGEALPGSRTSFDGVISGDVGTLTIVGNRVTLGASNTFVGDVQISPGSVLQLNNPGSLQVLPLASHVTLADADSTLLLYGNNTVGGLTGAAGSIVRPTAVAATATIGANNRDSVFAGVFANDGGNVLTVEKIGSGALALTGASTFTGGTTVRGGFVEFSVLNNFGTGSIALNGGGLRWASGSTTDVSPRLALGASGATFDTNGNNVTLGSAFSGSGALTKIGAGTLALSGANTYSGATTVNGGTLSIGAIANGGVASPLGQSSSSPVNLTLNGATLSYTGSTATTDRGFRVSNSDGGTIEIINTAANLTFTGMGTISGGGNNAVLRKTGAGTLTLGGGDNNHFLAARVTGGTLVLDKASGDTVHAIDGSGGLVIEGGIVRLAGSGGDQIENNKPVTMQSGFFDLNGRSETIGRLNGAGGVIRNDAASTVSTLTVSYGSHAGAIADGAGVLAIAKTGSGGLTLSGDNTYSGGTTLGGGTLTAGHVKAFGSGPIRIDAGTLNLGGFAVANALDVRGGSLAGLANYAGTHSISGAVSYSGTVGGTLTVGDGGALDTTGATFTGATTLQSGGTLRGTGTLGSLTVQSGGTLAPGNSPGLLTINGPLTLDSGSITNLEIAGAERGTSIGYDAINVSGLFTPGGTLNVSFASGYTPTGPFTFDFFNFTSIGGSFAQVNLPAVAGYTWDRSTLYIDGSASLIVSAIPEPATFAVLAGLGTLTAAASRRRRPLR